MIPKVQQIMNFDQSINIEKERKKKCNKVALNDKANKGECAEQDETERMSSRDESRQ